MKAWCEENVGTHCLRGKGHTGACKWGAVGKPGIETGVTSTVTVERLEQLDERAEIAALRDRVTELEEALRCVTEERDALQKELRSKTLDVLTKESQEMGMYGCVICGQPCSKTYCSNKCRQKAHRQRKARS